MRRELIQQKFFHIPGHLHVPCLVAHYTYCYFYQLQKMFEMTVVHGVVDDIII